MGARRGAGRELGKGRGPCQGLTQEGTCKRHMGPCSRTTSFLDEEGDRPQGTRSRTSPVSARRGLSPPPTSWQHPYPAALLEVTEPLLGHLLLPHRHLHLEEERQA